MDPPRATIAADHPPKEAPDVALSRPVRPQLERPPTGLTGQTLYVQSVIGAPLLFSNLEIVSFTSP